MAAELRYLREDLEAALGDQPSLLAWARAADGEVVRAVARRRTLRVELDGRCFFLKLHEGVGLREVLKSWLALKAPVLGARNEFDACRHLARCGIRAPRVAAFEESSGLPQARASFVLTDALLHHTDLETLSDGWVGTPPDVRELRRLVLQTADLARHFHEAGVAHRDFYICHLLRDDEDPDGPLAVLDLHRARIFPALPDRWRERDLAALLYSVMDLPLHPRAKLRFLRRYAGRPLREVLRTDGAFWRRVEARAQRLYAKGQRKGLNRA